MAGAGYDISLAASDSKALGQSTFGGTYIAFSGADLSGGQNTQTTKPTSDATATNRSPGTSNNSAGVGGDSGLTPLQQYQLSHPASPTSNVTLPKEAALGLAVVVGLLALAFFMKR